MGGKAIDTVWQDFENDEARYRNPKESARERVFPKVFLLDSLL